MKTHIISTKSPALLSNAIESATQLLRAGFPVALPTETVYGLAGAALNPEALFRIYSVKERPKFDPLIVHLPDESWIERIATLPVRDRDLIERLISKYWPGPLTLILPRKPIVPDLVASGLPTVAVRISAHRVFSAVVQAFGEPLAAPSANRFGRISPTQAAHVQEELDGRIHLILDGGPCQHGIESTIVAPRDGKLWVFRKGPVTVEELRAFGAVEVPQRARLPHAPGQLKSHYAPQTRMKLLPPDTPLRHTSTERAGLLAFCDDATAEGFAFVEVLSRQGSLEEAAETLFDKLRRLDALGLDVIYAESIIENRLGGAIMDRLRKAAGLG